MNKLKKIDKDIRVKFIIGFLVLITALFLSLWYFLEEQQKHIMKHHMEYVDKADVTIATLLDQARLNSYVTAQEIAVLLKRIEKGEINSEELLKHLEEVEKREELTGILLNQQILLVTDMEGYILARSEWIRGKRVEGIGLPQNQHVESGWEPTIGFKQAFNRALEEKEVDVRKIIYDRNFLYRESYDFWGLPGMGLTVMTPIIGEEEEQKGVLISITLLNANVPVVAGLKAVTNVSFTAIIPSGEVIGSIFNTDSVQKIEKISRSPELLAAAREKALEKGDLKRRGLSVPSIDFILKDFIIERIELTHADILGGTTYFYRVVYWVELDHQGNFVSLRGIAKDIEDHMAHENFLISLIGGTSFFFLITLVFFYFLIQRGLIYPITSFTTQLKVQKEGERIKIKRNYQEYAELEDAFNSSLNQAEEARNVLEIKVKARTRQLSELSIKLDKQVEEKTKELQKRIDELEKFSDVATGREVKMIELKEKIRELEGEIERLKKG